MYVCELALITIFRKKKIKGRTGNFLVLNEQILSIRATGILEL